MPQGALAADSVPGQVVVQLQPGAVIDSINQAYHTATLAALPGTGSYLLAAPAGSDSGALATAMSGDKRIASAEANSFASTVEANQWSSGFNGWTSGFNSAGAAQYQGQTAVSGVNYTPAVAGRTTGSGVTVAILDSGISLRSPELASRVLAGLNAFDGSPNTDDSPAGIDSNGNGIPDEAAGHGTMVAGIVHRFAPDAALLPVKVLDSDGTGTLWSMVAGIRFAVARHAAVINISAGSKRNSAVLNRAINDAAATGVLIVTSAGNDDLGVPQFPAGNPHTLTVASLNDDKTKAVFSNYGGAIDVDAPGVAIVSTFWDGSYRAWSGTSFSAPIVTAEAALIFALQPTMDAASVRQQILNTSHSVNASNPQYVGRLGKGSNGLVDFDAAIGQL
jgi:hypothetical protein